jgi:hypothetical protein
MAPFWCFLQQIRRKFLLYICLALFCGWLIPISSENCKCLNRLVWDRSVAFPVCRRRQWDEFIVIFNEYNSTDAHGALLKFIIKRNHCPMDWTIVPRKNLARTFPSDFVLISVLRTSRPILAQLHRSHQVKSIHPNLKYKGALLGVPNHKNNVKFNKFRSSIPFPREGTETVHPKHARRLHGLTGIAAEFGAPRIWKEGFTGRYLLILLICLLFCGLRRLL